MLMLVIMAEFMVQVEMVVMDILVMEEVVAVMELLHLVFKHQELRFV